MLALLAAGGAGYAISEVEDAKDKNKEGNQAVNSLRADFEVFREQVNDRDRQHRGATPRTPLPPAPSVNSKTTWTRSRSR